MQGTKLFAADVGVLPMQDSTKCEQVPTTKNDPFLSTRQMKLVALSSHAPTYEVACKGYDPTLHMQCASLLATIVSHMPRHEVACEGYDPSLHMQRSKSPSNQGSG